MNTPNPTTCPKCGAPLPADAPLGLCPGCLVSMNLAGETVFTGDSVPSFTPPLTPEELAPHFPQLAILECLGRGGMGVVYKARQKSLDRLVALKLLAPERKEDPQFAERFTREAQALAQLDHPHIVTVYDFGQTNGFFYLLMEYVDGVNLRQLLQARKLTPEEALSIVPPLCEALQFAHERGIVHRDIKPENLLLAKNGQVKIADFGVAKMLRAEALPQAEDQGAGTPGYMAPEQRETPHRTDSRADIYSLGVVFYEMLTGELPAKELQPPSRRVSIDVRLDEVVLKALEHEPGRRYQTAAELKTRVEAVKGNSDVTGPAGDAAISLPKRRYVAGALIITGCYGMFTFLIVLLSAFALANPILLAAIIALLATAIAAVPGARLAARWQTEAIRQPAATGSNWLKTFGWIALALAVVAASFGIVFILGVLGEGGGWHPAVDEAVFVSLSWIGMILLPVCAMHLFRAVPHRPQTSRDQPYKSARKPWAIAVFMLAVLVPLGAILTQLITISKEASARQQQHLQTEQQLRQLQISLAHTRSRLSAQESRTASAPTGAARLLNEKQTESLREAVQRMEADSARVQEKLAQIERPVIRESDLRLPFWIGALLAILGWFLLKSRQPVGERSA